MLRRIISNPYVALFAPLLVAGVGELLRERGVSLGVFLTVVGLVGFALGGFDQLRLRLSFRGSKQGFDLHFRWRAGTPHSDLPAGRATPAGTLSLIAQPPTMIARPLGLGADALSEIEVAVSSHEWTQDPAGKMILKLRVHIHNRHDAASRSIEQHWFLFAGWPKVNGARLSLQTHGLSQAVGPVRSGETLEGFIYATLPSGPHTGPDYDLFIQDELGHITKATKP
jgi:hypothetical protein